MNKNQEQAIPSDFVKLSYQLLIDDIERKGCCVQNIFNSTPATYTEQHKTKNVL